MSQSDHKELQEALENQIDIVLRLEQERLILLKENKIQKYFYIIAYFFKLLIIRQKINELVSSLSQASEKFKNCSDNTKNRDVDNKFIQTEEDEELYLSKTDNQIKIDPPNVLEEAYSLLKKYKDKGVESATQDSKKKNMKLSSAVLSNVKKIGFIYNEIKILIERKYKRSGWHHYHSSPNFGKRNTIQRNSKSDQRK
jgi:hypothetical protein